MLIGQAVSEGPSGWIVHPLTWFKLDELPLTERILVQPNGVHFQPGHRYLLVLTRHSSGKPGYFEMLTHSCAWGSIDLARFPLTKAERAVLGQGIPHGPLQTKSQALCREGEEVFDVFSRNEDGLLGHAAPFLLPKMRALAKLCRIEWCDPAYCHFAIDLMPE
ncbi:MAG: hypothetical protein D6690_05275 [Nitrospirae bacterium]|nr:MAG: hypothetical protein D6690_05275 [Nitrospirota bacterium]